MSHVVLAWSAGTGLASPIYVGVVNGAIYGLVALGLVLVYKSNRFFNFAQAEFGTVAAFATHALLPAKGSPGVLRFAIACAVGVVAAIAAALLTERVVIRPLFRAARVTLVVATAGVALLLVQLELLFGGAELRFFPRISTHPLATLAGGVVNVSWTDLIILGALVALALGSVVFFRTRYGLGILAVSQEPTAASAVGIDVRRMSMLTWGVAGLLGGVAGVVLAPKNGNLLPGFMTLGGPLINGFVAAVLGGMASLPGAFLGGVLVGLVQAFAGSYAPASIPGFQSVVVAALLLVVLLVRPGGLLGKEA